jgi:hypothetical protein
LDFGDISQISTPAQPPDGEHANEVTHNKNKAMPITEPIASGRKGNVLTARDDEIVTVQEPLPSKQRASAISQSMEKES